MQQLQLTEQMGELLYHVGRHEKQLQNKADKSELKRMSGGGASSPADARDAALTNIAILKGRTVMCMSCLRTVKLGDPLSVAENGLFSQFVGSEWTDR